ncbi:hypothetical protein Vqi01_16510 [Micromonospora qiuiae]|uniref:Uncharacterized protein n=1 Tax=Micromonospora qiuiae TaxID=502268 RepID=A0ABQ4J8I5_9ACTN|nr:hypothetical protein Vqi01_16510 [Micromonospora qiuiae]
MQFMYAVPDDAWHVELSEAVPAPASWADIPTAMTHLPGPAFLLAVVPDEDPAREPTISISTVGERDIPYEVMCWYMKKITAEVDRRRTAVVETKKGDR